MKSISHPLHIETKFWQQQLHHIAGVDEVGRGSFAGPVTAAAVVFPSTHDPILGIRDSKQLTPTQRSQLAPLITDQALSSAVVSIGVDIINRHGILTATLQAMSQALDQLIAVDHALVDGTHKPRPSSLSPSTIDAIPKGDSLCYSIAAASILAKVTRDQLMQELHPQFPHYHWVTNKGYGTAVHRQALLTHGPSSHHRTLFIRRTLTQTKNS